MFTWHFWTKVPCHFHKVSKAVQKSELFLTTCAKYAVHCGLLRKIRENFDEFDQQPKATFPNINYRSVIKRQRIMKGHKNNENVPNFQINSLQRMG